MAFLAGDGGRGGGLVVVAAAMTLWVTFVPCFLWVFAFAPYIEWIATRPRLGAALSVVAASLKKEIGTLALWFATHVFFAATVPVTAGLFAMVLPAPASLQPAPALIALGAGWLLLFRRWNLVAVLLLAAFAGGGIAAIG